MRKLNSKLVGLLTAMVAVGLWVAPAGADDLDVDTVSAALAFPVITGTDGGDTFTAITITNADDDVEVLHVFVLSGDPEDQWNAVSLDCPLSGRETTVFTVTPADLDGNSDTAESVLEVECSANGDEDDPETVVRAMPVGVGTMFVSLLEADDYIRDPANGNDDRNRNTKVSDKIFGDFVVVDLGAGTAYSAGAVGFQDEEGSEDDDFAFDFDDSEYSAFPTSLATNFIAPNNDISAELILFTLDGKPGDPPAQKMDILYYNDDEDMHDVRGINWDCFAILDFVQDIDFGLHEDFLGSPVGHLEILPRQAVAGLHDSAEDNCTSGDEAAVCDGDAKGDENGTRQSVFHGWLVQAIASGADVLGAGSIGGDAAFSRTLVGSGIAQTGLGDDTPSFDTEG